MTALLFSLKEKKLFSSSLKFTIKMYFLSVASPLCFQFALPFAFHITVLLCPDIFICQEQFILPEYEWLDFYTAFEMLGSTSFKSTSLKWLTRFLSLFQSPPQRALYWRCLWPYSDFFIALPIADCFSLRALPNSPPLTVSQSLIPTTEEFPSFIYQLSTLILSKNLT